MKGDQVRIRLKKPVKGAKYRTVDPGRKGRLQLVVMKPKGKKRTITQSMRFNIKDYKTKSELINAVSRSLVRHKRKKSLMKQVKRKLRGR